ncbi:MAG: putative monovalent cation/H+ antiporter subunit A [Anaerolineae bacterium]|nr:putative monovalent cation/H+ antiporter subunit A [Anaerolineae bacterium]
MFAAVLSGFALSLAAPWLHRLARGTSAWLIALLPAGLLAYFASFLGAISAGEILTLTYPWVPGLGINLSFYVDGLSLLFALLISGIGGLVVIYAGGYLAGHPQLGRFYAYLLMFMASMLGLVLAGNIITLFVFWELTSLSSYLLIGFYHQKEDSRAAALQALLVTGAGGLALLAGLILLGLAGGSLELDVLLNRGEVIRNHSLYLPLLVLILLGAFTKSAQFPFHFWLPGAMAAPAPVSSYLHSATMVKAGIYLLARFSPILGGTELWQYALTLTGGATMLIGAYLSWQHTDLKRILAYSTISALGTLVLLIGLGTSVAIKAAIFFLIVHSLYKGALFMAAGAIDHETGTRDITHLSGLRHMMPVTFAAVSLAALSMAGALPFLVGYIGKKLIYEATLTAPSTATLLTAAAMLANSFTIVAAGLVAYRPFFGPKVDTPQKAHEAPLRMWLGPLVLASLGLLLVVIIEFLPGSLFKPLLAASAAAVLDELIEVKLTAWSGFNLVFILSLITLAAGVGLYAGRDLLRRITQRFDPLAAWGPEQWYHLALRGMLRIAQLQTEWLQNGYLRRYLLVVIATIIGLTGYTLFTQVTWPDLFADLAQARYYEWFLAALILGAVLAVGQAESRLAAIAALGVIGYTIALIYILYGAPDLAMTQVAVETLTVILFVLVLYRLPRFARMSSRSARLRDLLVALAAGGLMTLLTLVVRALPAPDYLTPFFAMNSLVLANGRNVVNVILVDFRGLDTLGEITVLAAAAVGVFALLKLRLGGKAP